MELRTEVTIQTSAPPEVFPIAAVGYPFRLTWTSRSNQYCLVGIMVEEDAIPCPCPSELISSESYGDGVWKLWRDEPDFSPLNVRQRYTGTISEDGTSIVGAWELCHDGTTWEHDFDLI